MLMAWSPGTSGGVSGTPILAEVASPADFDSDRGRLRGAIVLNGKPRTEPATNFSALAERFRHATLAEGEGAIEPVRSVLELRGA
jgi:hypothetical protein